jgi:hypothetical protein
VTAYSGFEEVWVKLEDGRAMCALINPDHGCLFFLREPGDPGFSSRNPSYDGPAEARVEFLLENGQRDEYPAKWVLPAELVRRAMAYFETQRQPPPFICWHNDSGDGAVIPYHPL